MQRPALQTVNATRPQRRRALLPVIVWTVLATMMAALPATRASASVQEPSPAPESPVEEAGSEEEPGLERARPRFQFNGFATLGVANSSEDQADFAAGLERPDGPGFSHEWSTEPDSRLGLQLTALISEKLSAVVQVVVEQQYDDEVEPAIEWANLKYAVTEDFSLRIGRTALPGFVASDYRKVGYAYPRVRPPVEFYGLAPLFSSDGFDLSYRHRFAGWTHTLQGNLGYTEFDLPGGATVEIDDIVGFHNTFDRGFLSLRATFTSSRIDVEATQPLFDAFRAFGPEGQGLADRFDVEDKDLEFAAFGATWDPERWFATAELGRIRTNSFIGDRTAGHLTVGLRVGRFTAFGVYAESSADSPLSTPGLTLSGLPPPLVPVAAGLNATLDDLLASLVVQRTASLGLRWNYRENAAFKVQIDRIDVDVRSFGTFTNRQPGFERGSDATLLSFTADIVF